MAMASLAVTPLGVVDAAACAQADPFGLGVASGDPGRDGFVLWTRLVGAFAEPLAADAVEELLAVDHLVSLLRSLAMR